MTCAAAVLLFLVSCATLPQETPAAPADMVREIIQTTRSRNSYKSAFKARLQAPEGDPIDYDGTSVWVSPGVLYIHYTASGGDLKNIVRVGAPGQDVRVWVHHPVADWVTAEEMGSPGLGRGIQNPDEILDVLSQHLSGAKARGEGKFEITFTGEDIEKVLKEQNPEGAFDWKESTASLTLEADDEKRLKKITCSATLKPVDPEVKGSVRYTATVEVESFDKERELKFLDADGKEIPLTDEIRKAIAEALKQAPPK